MDNRLKLHEHLKTLCRNVYYQTPGNLGMNYPCIVYTRTNYNVDHADNIKYKSKTRYDITIIDRKPDSDIIDKILLMDYSSFDRQFITQGLNHFVLKLYY